jgi:hypothetical protein
MIRPSFGNESYPNLIDSRKIGASGFSVLVRLCLYLVAQKFGVKSNTPFWINQKNNRNCSSLFFFSVLGCMREKDLFN